MAFLTIEIAVLLVVIHKLLWNTEDHCQDCLDLICCAVDNSTELKNICLMNGIWYSATQYLLLVYLQLNYVSEV